jgi:hypothetical protein
VGYYDPKVRFGVTLGTNLIGEPLIAVWNSTRHRR